MEVLTHKQKLRFLLTEQSKKVDEARLQNLKKMRKAQDDMLGIQTSLKELVNQKSRELRQAQIAMHELLRQMKLENSKNISKVKNETCLEIARLERDFLRLTLERENRDDIAIDNERELVKNKHLQHVERLQEIHGSEMDKTQAYFHSITINNLATIAALQDEIREMKQFEKKIIQELGQSNKDLRALEKRLREDNEERQKYAMKDSKVTENIRKELRKMRKVQETKDKYARSMEIANEALLQKMSLMEGESRAFKNTVTKAILDMQQEAAMKRMILELKLNAAHQNRNNQSVNREIQPSNHEVQPILSNN